MHDDIRALRVVVNCAQTRLHEEAQVEGGGEMVALEADVWAMEDRLNKHLTDIMQVNEFVQREVHLGYG